MNRTLRAPPIEMIRVLLVEDDPIVHRLLTDLLDAAATVRFLISRVATLEEGLDSLQHGQFDVCLLNAELADGVGLDLLTSAGNLGMSLPMIVLEGEERSDVDRHALALGAVACLDKDRLDPKGLERAIRFGIHQHKLAQGLARSTLLDEATGLASPTLYRDRLDRAIAFAGRHGIQVAVMMIDFAIPLEMSEKEAESLLAEAGTELKHVLRDMDTVAHFSDRRLAVLIEAMPGVDRAALIARRLLRVLKAADAASSPSAPSEGPEPAPKLPAASIGVAVYPSEGVTCETLMRRAEAALRQARAEGGGRCRFASERIDHEARTAVNLERMLRDAIKTKNLRLRFHPEMHLRREATGLAAEAFWRHPKEGWRPFDEAFLGIEDDRLAAEMVDWMTASIGERLAGWQEAGLERATLSVTFPCRRPSLLPILTDAIQRQVLAKGSNAEQLEIDLPASLVLAADQRDVDGLRGLRATGVRLAMDQFGATALRLQDLPFDLLDGLKLAPGLYHFRPGDKRRETVLRTIITLGHSLNLRVTAKAAEDQRQFALLKKLGCDIIQLRGLLAPMSAKAATNWLKTPFADQKRQSATNRPGTKPEFLTTAGKAKISQESPTRPSIAPD